MTPFLAAATDCDRRLVVADRETDGVRAVVTLAVLNSRHGKHVVSRFRAWLDGSAVLDVEVLGRQEGRAFLLALADLVRAALDDERGRA